jgi:hypothetical protein
MVATVVGVVVAHNLAIDTLNSVLLSGIFYAFEVAQLFRVTWTLSEETRWSAGTPLRVGTPRLSKEFHHSLQVQGGA